jgi:hypothetical protein
MRVPAGHARGGRQALEELTDTTATELPVADKTVTFEIWARGRSGGDAEDEMVSVARRFECTLQRMRVDGLYSPWT